MMIETIIGAAVGGVLGVAGTLIGYKLSERGAIRRDQQRAREEDLDMQLYAEVIKATKEGHVFSPDLGSDAFKRAVRLQERGLLERLPFPGRNYFTLPGAMIKVDTSQKIERPATHSRSTTPKSIYKL